MKLTAKAILKKAEGNRASVVAILRRAAYALQSNARHLEWGSCGGGGCVAMAPSWKGKGTEMNVFSVKRKMG